MQAVVLRMASGDAETRSRASAALRTLLAGTANSGPILAVEAVERYFLCTKSSPAASCATTVQAVVPAWPVGTPKCNRAHALRCAPSWRAPQKGATS
jgi:hypothetical protein